MTSGLAGSPSPMVKIPLLTSPETGQYVDASLQNLQKNLYVNIKVLGFGSPGQSTASIGNAADLTATDVTLQDPATEHASNTAVEPVLIDTGSWATVLSQDFVTQSLAQAGVTFSAQDLATAGYTAGSLTYSSSNNTESGFWVPITIGFPDARNPDGSMVTTTVTALITDGSGHTAMMGVGVNAAFAIPTVGEVMTPDNNAFLSVAQMRDGSMAHSFAIKNDGIYLGENKADAQAEGGWTLQDLQPSTLGHSPNGVQDWQFPTTTVTVGAQTYADVSMMIDTGIPEMFLETSDGGYHTTGQSVSVSMEGEQGASHWGFTSPGSEGATVTASSPGSDQRLAPTTLSTSSKNPHGTWTPSAIANVKSGYTNTGVNVLRGYNYLYDADSGVFGLSAADRNLATPSSNPGGAPPPGSVAIPTPTSGADFLTAAVGSTVAGGSGDDTIVGSGSNLLFGNQGNDQITAADGNNTVVGGTGNDRVAVGNGSNLVYGNEGSDTIQAGDGGNTIVGGQDSTDGTDLITSGSGNDLILGNGGDDTVGSGAGADSVIGGFGRDLILGNQGDDLLLGNQDDDTLLGGQGGDTVVGGMGNDVLYGNEGDDVLYGNEGLNTFVFAPGDTDFRSDVSTGDTVMDFVTGTSRIDFTSGPAGSATNFGAGSTTAQDFASAQAVAQGLINSGDAYAFVSNGTDGYLFTTGGSGTVITDAVKLAGAGAANAVKFTDIAHGALG